MFDVQHTYKNPDSRFVTVKGSRQGKMVTLASVYALNGSQASFFTTFFQALDRYHSPHLMTGSDFNLVVHSRLDISHIGFSSNAFPKSLQYSLRSHQLIDTWRAHNIGIWGYIFYSHTHDSYSLLDYIFCSPILVVNPTSADIHVSPWSDHHIVSCNLSCIGLSKAIGPGALMTSSSLILP